MRRTKQGMNIIYHRLILDNLSSLLNLRLNNNNNKKDNNKESNKDNKIYNKDNNNNNKTKFMNMWKKWKK